MNKLLTLSKAENNVFTSVDNYFNTLNGLNILWLFCTLFSIGVIIAYFFNYVSLGEAVVSGILLLLVRIIIFFGWVNSAKKENK